MPLPALGGLHAPEAVELLRAFYLRGNPNGACFVVLRAARRVC